MTFTRRLSHLATLCALSAAALLAGCVEAPKQQGLSDVLERPAERALFTGIRAYDDAQYAEAEAALLNALAIGLSSPKDRATASKLLAFVYCTSNRVPACEAAFRSARQSDPAFALTRSEAGHPVWGPVYRKAVAQ